MAYELIGIQEETGTFAAREGEILPTIWRNMITCEYFVQYVNEDFTTELQRLGFHTDDGLRTPTHREIFVYYSNGRGMTEQTRTVPLQDGCPKTANRLVLASSRQPKRKGVNPNRTLRSVQFLLMSHPCMNICMGTARLNPQEDAVLAWRLPDGRYVVDRAEWLYQSMAHHVRHSLDATSDKMLKQTVLNMCHQFGADNIPEHWREKALQACYREFARTLGPESRSLFSNIQSWSETYFGFPAHQRRWETT